MQEFRGTLIKHGKPHDRGRLQNDLQQDLESNTTTTLETRPIVWAVDVFPDQIEMHFRLAETIEGMFPSAPVHPVYVLSEESFADRGFSGALRPALKPMAAKAMASLLHELPSLHCKRPRVLIEKSASRQACAYKLLRYAEKVGAQSIALATHARGRWSRLFMESFSDAIIEQSQIPVMITGPKKLGLGRQIENVVFATDFSPACAYAYGKLLEIAPHWGAEVHLFHKPLIPIDPVVQTGMMFGGGWIPTDLPLESLAPNHGREAEEWLNMAAEAGITARFVSQNFREPTAEAIVEYLQALDPASSVVAMVSQTGHLASALLGSVTHEVIRSSPCPVLVMPRPA